MTQAPARPIAERQRCLAEQLTGYWAQDVWNVNECHLLLGTNIHISRKFHFRCKSPGLNLELKYAFREKFERREWKITAETYQSQLGRLVRWLNHTHPHAQSLYEKSLQFWQVSLRTFMQERGTWNARRVEYMAKDRAMVTYTAEDKLICFLNSIYKVLEEFYDEREEYEKDIWSLRALGVQPERLHTLNFTRIHQPWLRDASKKQVRHILAKHTSLTCESKINSLTHLSNFLKESHPSLRPEAFSRGVVEEFMAYLLKRKLHGNTRGSILCDIRQFHEGCVRYGWAPLPPQTLIYKEDFPSVKTPEPRHLPDYVVDRLLASLSGADAPRELERMVRIDLHTGMRVGDLLALKRDCLVQDSEGDYWITFYIKKLKKDHALPIDREMAEMIREQQKDVADCWGNSTSLLFPNHRGGPRSRTTVARAINALVAANDVRNPDGTPYQFQFHQMRHTCGTRMINSGYPHKVVQEWLGHESPQMTDRYAKLYDRTKKEAFKKYLLARGPLINIKGEVINLDSPVDGVEHQALKDQIKDRRLALPNGHCTRPIPLGPCPHYNACYQCASFATDRRFLPIHEKDLQETKRNLAIARQNGWQRHAEKHEEDQKGLTRIIAKLKQEGLVGDAEP